MKTLDFNRVWVRIVFVLICLLFSHEKLKAQDFSVTIRAEQMDACPGDPLSFKAEVSRVLNNPTYEWFVMEGGDWKPKGRFRTPNFGWDAMPSEDFLVKVVVTEPKQPTGPIAPVKPAPGDDKVESDPVTVYLATNCTHKVCHQTTTGEYYGGTDFNQQGGLVNWGTTPPSNLEEYFTERGIIFSGDSKGDIKNQTELGVSLHIDDSLGVNPNNSFYVVENINDNLFNIVFPHNQFVNKYYRFTMRFYLIFPEDISRCHITNDQKIILRTGHGTASEDYMDVVVYDDAKNIELRSISTNNRVSGSGVAWDIYWADGKMQQALNEGTRIFRFEVLYFGYLPDTHSGDYSFGTRFEQFPNCATVAIDYISAEEQSVCVTPRSACVNTAITVNAAGFPKGAEYQWVRYSDKSCTQVVPWRPGEVSYTMSRYDQPVQAHITMMEPGTFYYSVSDKGNDPIYFTLVGRDCNWDGPGIAGDSKLCLETFPFERTYSGAEESNIAFLGEYAKDYVYVWSLLDPNGNPNNPAETNIELVPSSDRRTATLRVKENPKTSDQYSPEAPYTMLLGLHSVVGGQEVNSYLTKLDTLLINVFDQPNISRLNFVTSGGAESICAANSSDTIILQNKEDIDKPGYKWNFKGAKMDANGVIHLEGYDKNALCGSTGRTFPVELEVENRLCKATFNDEFKVDPTDAPTIDCSKLSEPNEYELRPSQLDTIIKLPIPSYTTSCDTDPALNVHISFIADEAIHNFDTTFVLRKAQLDNKDQLTFKFYSGKGTIHYSLVDGCNKRVDCETSLQIKDVTKPDVDCSEIPSYDVAVTTEDGCQAVPGANPQLPTLKPIKLRDLTYKDTIIYIEGKYAGRSEVNPATDPGLDPTKYSTATDLNAPYGVGVTYILWKYEDPAGLAVYCHSRVKVENNEEPFYCDSLTDIRASVNENKAGLLYQYASAQAQSTKNPDTKYSLEGLLKVPTSNPKYCGNVQLEILFSGDCIDDDGNVLKVAKDSVISGDNLLKHKFPVGLTELTFRFITDNDTVRNKKDTIACQQKVIVASKFGPVPNNCPKDTTLYVDENCQAMWNLTLNRVPTATIPYFKEVKYTYDKCSGGAYDYASLGVSSELSKTYDTLGYPYMVRRISYLDDNWNRVAGSTQVYDCANLFTENDKVVVKEVHHRNDDKSVCAKDVIETMNLMVSNFAELPSCVTDPFGKGKHIVVWYYDNGKGVLDSCVTKFTVVDTIAPKKECGKWGKRDTFYCDESCEVPYSEVNIIIPTISDLNATDNCTKPEDLKITWVREFEGQTINTLEQNYPLGVTTIKWIVTDEANNSSNCVQTIEVLDTLPPFFDCSSLDTIKAFANERCVAPANEVVTSESTPKAEDDPCSPTGGPIKGVGVRYIEVDGQKVPDGKDLYKDDYPKGYTYIVWTFEDAKHNAVQCEQVVFVSDTTPPVIPECGNMDPIVIMLQPEDCEASRDLVKEKLGTRTGHDNCDGDINGTPMLMLADSSIVELPEFFKKDATYQIAWVFVDNEGNKTICYQLLEIRDVTPPDPSAICQDPTKIVPATVECSVDYNALKLTNPVLDDPCDGLLYPDVYAYVSQKDGSKVVYHNDELLTARYPVGTHRFVWIYTDKAMLQDSCVTTLTVTDSVPLKLDDCDVDKYKEVTLPIGECALKASELKNHIKFPTAYDMCDEEYIEPRIERRFEGNLVVGEDGKPIAWDSQDFPLGRTDIRWIFVDKLGVMKDSCEKTLVVKTELFDCSTLKDTITVNLLENFSATAAEVRAAGLEKPVITIDNCNAATISFSRSDGLTEADDYQIGLTTVYWTFDYVFGDQKVCSQVVDINDMVPPVLICPPLESTTFECYGEIPAPYPTFEAFQFAGGSISDIQKYKVGSYRYEESDNGASSCNYQLTRTYYVQDVRGNWISCSQNFAIHDVTAPVITNRLDTLVISCEQEIPAIDSTVMRATDNCTPSDKIQFRLEVTNNRSSNPKSCDYNNYTIWRSWTAVDTCGNVSSPLVQVVLVVDTTAPTFDLPADWRDTVLANNIKNCEVDVPVLTDLVRNYIHDACTDASDIKLWQFPLSGTILDETTTVFIYAQDLCGNKDSLSVVVFVDRVKNIVTLNANPLVLCGSDTSSINLWSQEVRLAVGRVYVESVDEILSVPSIFAYDCYRGGISEANLVYSNNKQTYAHKFAHPNPAVQDSIFRSKVNLRKREQSDYYYFVAMDTLTQCMDTAVAYLTIHERPRLSMISDTFYHCENDTLNVDDLFFEHNVCIDAMGLDITKTGWTIDGVDYVEGTSLPFVGKPQAMYYFAENECGRTTTYDSYFTYCGEAPATKKDSIALVESEKNLELWRKDELFSKDSIVFIVNQRYKSDSIFLSPISEIPSNSIWIGEEVTLKVNTPYSPAFYMWKAVSGKFDGARPNAFDKNGERIDKQTSDAEDAMIYFDDIDRRRDFKYAPEDTALVYVLIGDGVCPAMPSNVFRLNVMNRLPTAFTPFNKDDMNDYFMRGFKVTIFDRYGQCVFQGDDGWDGSGRGGFVDPGVYFYDVQLKTRSFQGTIEVVYMK